MAQTPLPAPRWLRKLGNAARKRRWQIARCILWCSIIAQVALASWAWVTLWPLLFKMLDGWTSQRLLVVAGIVGQPILGTAGALFVLRVIRQRERRELRLREGLCVECGYDLRASTERCPECGSPIVEKA